jgi:predicted flap endonuclease-1-like 5' DNA nuclease
MSWYTAGEIVVWLLIAAVLGGVLGWLLRGILRPARPKQGPTPVVIADEPPARTRIDEIDTGASGTLVRPITDDDSVFAPDTAKDRVAEIARRTAGGLTPPHDDLVRIHGVGPKIAKLLNSMEITSFRQVARFSAEDVAVVNEALEVFPGRIERDDWMSSARELHREVYGSDPVA